MRLVSLVLVALLSCILPCKSESLTGVLYAASGGASGRGSGTITLAAEGKVYDLYYTKPLPSGFHSAICLDIGALWSADVTSSMEIVHVQCDGRVNVPIHAAWVLVGKLLTDLLHGDRPAAKFFSAQFVNSKEGEATIDGLQGLDFSRSQMMGVGPKCLEVAGIGAFESVQIQTGPECYIASGNRSIDLKFTVAHKKPGNDWQIVSATIN